MQNDTAPARVAGVSDRLPPFLASLEGFVGSTYRDAGGLPTIGYGFTMLSASFARYWRESRGRALKSGDTIGRDEADRVLRLLLDTEYAPPVTSRFTAVSQHVFDAATSVVFNAGPATLHDKWAAAVEAGEISEAADLLRQTRITSGGRRLDGLVRRREREARLLEHGDYGGTNASVITYQTQLATLGFYEAAIDGLHGPLTDEAVRAFQQQNGLAMDGIVGPATRAALVRAIEARTALQVIPASGAVAASGGAAASLPADAIAPTTILAFGIAGLCLAALLFLAWRYRGLILRRRTPA